MNMVFGFLTFSILGQENQYEESLYVKDNDTLLYRIMYPKDFSENNQYPLVLFLHGAGERGNDNEKQLVHGSKLFANEKIRNNFPAIVIFPQCPVEDYWANVIEDTSTLPKTLIFPEDSKPKKIMQLLLDFMDEFITNPFVEKEQVYVGGLSMGAKGTYEILSRRPNMFSAAFAICGAGNTNLAQKYAQKVPMWIFHGSKDDVTSPQYSIDMVSSILKNGGKPNFSLYADDNHNSWDSAFAEPELLPWLFSKSK